MREGREISWGKGGFFRTPVYRAELSSQVGSASRFRKSEEGEEDDRKIYSGGFKHLSLWSLMTSAWFSQPQLARKTFQNTFLKSEYWAKPMTEENAKEIIAFKMRHGF